MVEERSPAKELGRNVSTPKAPTEYAAQFGNYVRMLRSNRNWSREFLARWVGISGEAIRKIEAGKTEYARPEHVVLMFWYLDEQQYAPATLLKFGYPIKWVHKVAQVDAALKAKGKFKKLIEEQIHFACVCRDYGYPFEAEAQADEISKTMAELGLDESSAGHLHFALKDAEVEARLQTSVAADLQRLERVCKAEKRLAYALGSPLAQGKAHLRSADLFWQSRQLAQSLDEIDKGLSCPDENTKYELLRIRMEVECARGDWRAARITAQILIDALQNPDLSEHHKGCLSQAVGRVLALLDGPCEGLVFIDWGKTFASEPLIRVLNCRSEAFAALCEGSDFAPQRSADAARRGLKLAFHFDSPYERVSMECNFLLEQAKLQKPVKTLLN